MFGFLEDGSTKDHEDVKGIQGINDILIELFGNGYNLLRTTGVVVLVICIIVSGIKLMLPQTRMSRMMAEKKIEASYVFIFGIVFFMVMNIIDLASNVGSNFKFI